MDRHRKPPVWPWLVALASLLVLSLLAVRVWRSEPRPQRLALLGQDLAPQQNLVSAKTAEGDAEANAQRQLQWQVVPRYYARPAPPVADRVSVAVADDSQTSMPSAPAAIQQPVIVAQRAARVDSQRTRLRDVLPRHNSAATEVRAARKTPWPRAEALHAQLEELASEPNCAQWARDVQAQLTTLEQTSALGEGRVAKALDKLAAAAQQGHGLLTQAEAPHAWSKLQRACYAISRRVEVWRKVHTLVHEERTWLVSLSPDSVQSAIGGVSRLLAQSNDPEAPGWRAYLMVDDLLASTSAKAQEDPAARRDLARRVLERINAVQLTEAQKRFLAGPEWTRLAEQLRLWAYEPIDYAEFLQQIEGYELQLASGRVALANDWKVLRWSPWQQTDELAQLVDTHYRNANLRIAVTSELINRLLPEMNVMEEDVNDQVLGARVRGRSMTVARLFVVLMPDKLAWRFGLIARGQVDSRTRSAKGPVTFFNTGATLYRARKLLTIDRRGIRLEDAMVEAQAHSRLMDVATDFDTLPLVGSLVRSIAVREHNDRLGEANAEVEYKVSSRAAQRLDEEVLKQLELARQKYQDRLIEPLNRLQLNPIAMDMQTTDERLVVRYRIAADHQLAAYTPRPQAPRDSLLSVQVNESIANNAIAQLHLDGRRIELQELFKEITSALGMQDQPLPEDFPENVTIEFADQDAIRITLDQGDIGLTLRIAALKAGRNVWRDFEVHSRFTPVVQGRRAWLQRHEYIELRGGQLGFRDRLPLRGIFTAVLAKEKTFPLMLPMLEQHPRLQDTVITQLVIRDGWLGLAIGPAPRVASHEGRGTSNE